MPVGPNIVTTVAPSKFQGATAARQLSRLIKSTHSPSLPVEPSLRAKKNLDTKSKVKFLVEKVQTPHPRRVYYLFVVECCSSRWPSRVWMIALVRSMRMYFFFLPRILLMLFLEANATRGIPAIREAALQLEASTGNLVHFKRRAADGGPGFCD